MQPQGFLFSQGRPQPQQMTHDDLRSSPFVQGQYGNNAFNPQRVGSKPMVS